MFNKFYLLGMMVFAIQYALFATNYYVNNSDLTGDVFTTAVGNNSNSGTSPGAPKATLSNLLSTYSGIITSGDLVFIDAGSYLMTDANIVLGASFNGISIIGAGSSLTFFNNNSTSVDANRWANVTGSNITLQGIYLTGYNYGLGGASTLNISGAVNLTVTDVQINENSSGGGASAIVISGGSSVNFSGGGSNCNPSGSSVAGGGVNIEGNGNIVSFTNYTLTGNAKSLQGGSGMRISGDNTTFVTITNSTVSDNVNTSAEGGAGIYISGANLTITNSCVTGNSTLNGSGPKYGGGITLARGATLNASNCHFGNNLVSNSGKGGAISINTSFTGSGTTATATFTTCSFTNNSADSEGNHIYLRVGSSNPATIIINECTFSATAQDVRQDNSGTVTVTNSGTSLTLSGTNITNNAIAPMTTATTFCPSSTVPCFSILPVELIEFSANCDDGVPVIHWTTASERNNDYFLLERLLEDETFSLITIIKGNGNSQNEITYSYTDLEARPEINYYRLSQVDFNGQRETFSVISTENCAELSETIINYSKETESLRIKSDLDQLGSLREVKLVSMVGQMLFSVRFNDSYSDKQQISLGKRLSVGTYFVRLIFNHHEETVKISVN